MTIPTVEPITKQITVAAPQATAFEVFTAGMGRWWNRDFTIGAEPLVEVVVEPLVGGRWFERGETGTECDWGRVLAWEPPYRVVFAWQITADWTHDPNITTELEVRFEETGAGSTLVQLEHRGLEALGEPAPVLRGIFDSAGGWASLLDSYRDAVVAR